MNIYHRMKPVLAALAAVMLLGGCGLQDTIEKMQEQPWEPDATSLQIQEDGSVTETLLEKLDREYYKGSELSAMVQEAVAAYNREAGDGRVTAEPVLAGKTTATVVLHYASGEDCAAFNNSVFFCGSMLDAEMKGFLFCQDFAKVEKDGTLRNGITWEEVLSHKEYQVAVCDRLHKVQVPGKIVYLSEGASLERKDVAVPPAAGDAGDALSYYLPGVSGNVEKEREQEKSYLYVIYE